MRSTRVKIAALVLSLAAMPAAAETLDEVVAKHVEARGGADAWAAIKTMRLTGEYTAFSKVEPFTLTRAADNSYLLDTVMNGRTVIIGYDGETAWWDNHWFQEGPQRITGLDEQVAIGDSHFATPLFNYGELGMKAEYLGPTEYEGMKVLGVKLTRPDGEEETWYLDPATYLETARLAPGSDFGRPQPQRTFYGDFREVEGVTIPFYVETQWYTRDRVMDVAQAELNVELDDGFFGLPAPAGMAELLQMVGSWHVADKSRSGPGAPLTESEMEIEIGQAMDGRIVQTHHTRPDGNAMHWTLSYDPFRSNYRMTQFFSASGYMDILQGVFDDAGKLTMSNMETGTPYLVADLTVHSRFSISELSADGFKIEMEATMDGGENWFVSTEQVYTRKTE